MPTRPPAPCSAPGCRNRKPCPDHGKPWRRDPAITTTERGYGYRWEQTKKRILLRDRICSWCGGPQLEDDEVDHIRPKSRGGTDEDNNLARIHKTCHAIKTARESRVKQSRKE